MQVTVNQRVKMAREYVHLEQEDVAKAISKPTTAISKIENGKQEVPTQLLSFYNSKYNISADWILSGEGEMILNNLQDYSKRTDKREDLQSVPLYSFEAAAGLTKLFSNSESVLHYISIPNLPKSDGAIYISGDSMYPLLKSGDIVIYKQIHDIKNNIFFGEMYLLSVKVDDDYLTLVKYIQRSEKGEEWVCLVSQNQHHPPKDIPIENIRALAYIKASIRINSMV